MDNGIEALTPEMARESGNILIIVAARLARKECLTPLHTLSELGQRTISTRALNDAIERAEESLSREAGKIRDGYDRLTKMLRETESALVQAQRQNGYLREQSAEWERKAISNFEECSEMSSRIGELESQRSLAFMACNRWRDKCVDAEKRIAELESSPNGMMQLSNELAEMKRKCAELQEQKDKWAAWAISLGAKADELESSPLCVKSNDAMREAAPLCVKLPEDFPDDAELLIEIEFLDDVSVDIKTAQWLKELRRRRAGTVEG